MPLDGSGVYSLPAGNPMPFKLKPLPSSLLNSTFSDLKDALNSRLWKGGGTMTGALTLAGNPSGALDAAPKQYVDLHLPKAGGTLTGALNGTTAAFSGTVSGATATAAGHLVTKAQLDAVAATAGVASFNTRTGAVTLSSSDVTTALGFTPVTNARSITAGTGLTGGGDLTANRSFAFDTTWGDARYAQLAGANFSGAISAVSATLTNGASWTTSDWRKAVVLDTARAVFWAKGVNPYALGFGASGDTFYWARSTADDNSAAVTYPMQLSAAGRLSTLGGADLADTLQISGSSTLASSYGGTIALAASMAGSVHRLFIGDGSGWVFRFARRSGGVTTERLEIHDNAQLRAFSGASTDPSSVAFSATPTFDARNSNVFYFGTLTGNVTSMTISQPTDGQTIQIRFVQDGAGSKTVALPSGAVVSGSINPAANSVTWLVMTWVNSASRFEGTWTRIS